MHILPATVEAHGGETTVRYRYASSSQPAASGELWHRSRIQKIVDIAHRPEPPRHLRVCWQNRPGARNCGRCAKCAKAMMPVALEGVLDRYGVFPPLPAWDAVDPACFEPLDLDKIRARNVLRRGVVRARRTPRPARREDRDRTHLSPGPAARA